MELCVDENSMVFQNDGFSERSAGETVMEAKKFTKEASQRLSLFEEEYERVGTVLTCGMAVMEARMTRTKRDVSVGIHSSSHGHEIMSDFTSPGPFRHKTARVTAVVSQSQNSPNCYSIPLNLVAPFYLFKLIHCRVSSIHICDRLTVPPTAVP